jgi:hypothetical protein
LEKYKQQNTKQKKIFREAKMSLLTYFINENFSETIMKKERSLALLAMEGAFLKIGKFGIIGGSLAYVAASLVALSLDLSERRARR